MRRNTLRQTRTAGAVSSVEHRRLLPPRQIHAGILIVTLVLISFGLVMLFSASMSIGYSSEGDALYFVIKQAGITLIGLVLALFIALMIPVKFFDHFGWTVLVYLLTLGGLIYVQRFGMVINGARRWVRLAGTTFQPSELAKITLIFCFAGYQSMLKRRRQTRAFRFKNNLSRFIANGWLDILIPGLGFLIPIALIAAQPHISCALILAFLALVLLISAGLPLASWVSAFTQLLLLTLVVVLVVSLAVTALPGDHLKELINEKVTGNFAHVSKRIDSFLRPETVSDDALYQVNQAIIAMGSGGLKGVGLGEGRQKYNYLPEAHNDYVFAIIGEELGFAGTVTIILLFLLFMFLGIGITRRANSLFATLLAAGYTMLISVQAMLNFGVATRLLPPTGVSLPFFSYGGTSNLFFIIAIGLLLAVSRTGRSRLSNRTVTQPGRRASGEAKSFEPQRSVSYPVREVR